MSKNAFSVIYKYLHFFGGPGCRSCQCPKGFEGGGYKIGIKLSLYDLFLIDKYLKELVSLNGLIGILFFCLSSFGKVLPLFLGLPKFCVVEILWICDFYSIAEKNRVVVDSSAVLTFKEAANRVIHQKLAKCNEDHSHFFSLFVTHFAPACSLEACREMLVSTQAVA